MSIKIEAVEKYKITGNFEFSLSGRKTDKKTKEQYRTISFRMPVQDKNTIKNLNDGEWVDLISEKLKEDFHSYLWKC